MIKYLIIFLLSVSLVSAAEISNSQYRLTVEPVSGIMNSSNGSFRMDANIGQPIVGTLENSKYSLTLGVLSPAEYVPPPAEGPTSSGGGGGGGDVAAAEAANKTQQPAAEEEEKTPMDPKPLIFTALSAASFVIVYNNFAKKREEDKKRGEPI
jgi:hypothetical protein